MQELTQIGKQAKKAQRLFSSVIMSEKNNALEKVAQALIRETDKILEANKKDLDNAQANGMKKAMVDRLTLTKERVEGMAGGVSQVAKLPDPIGSVEKMWKRPNGLKIGKMRVPIGVVGIIYESRPNVTSDAFAITFKTGNACILRGGSDSINSVIAIADVIRNELESLGIDPNMIQIISDTDRKYVTEMLHLTEYIDVIIPRGGHKLIQHVVNESTVPVIRTGTGNCHVYVDKDADIDMAVDIIENAKTQRISVCNACESLVVHKDIEKELMPKLVDRLFKHNVEMRGDEACVESDERVNPAAEEDFGTEYLDYIISVKTVNNVEEAIDHINTFGTGHSETIVTDSYETAEKFLNEVDAACVYVNASTRFTDGEEFGFGAEIGISTQKIHARGPMGLEQMTSVKYVIYGNGQIR